jgi:hypothetical protein
MSCGYGRLGRQDRPPGRSRTGRALAARRDWKRVSFCVERSVEHRGGQASCVLGHAVAHRKYGVQTNGRPLVSITVKILIKIIIYKKKVKGLKFTILYLLLLFIKKRYFNGKQKHIHGKKLLWTLWLRLERCFWRADGEAIPWFG